GRLVTAHPWSVCLCWLVLCAVLPLLAPAWDSRAQDDDIRFLPDRCPSVRAYHILQQAFPQDVFASRAVFALERPDRPLDRTDFALVDRLVSELERLKQEEPELGIGGITSCRDALIGSRLTSDDQHCTLIQVSLATPFLALQTRDAMDQAEK